MKTAQQSNEIVSSLFPKNVAAQMMEEANYESLTRSQATQKAFKSFNTSESSFTGWSSMREPGQIFTSVETIFNAFDKSADRRKVFKVEWSSGCPARFQLFGDTVNKASRIETSGLPGRIHLSKETADLLIARGKSHWVEKRHDTVDLKGLGNLCTYWLNFCTDDGTSITDLISDASNLNFSSHHGDFAPLVSPLISKNLKVRKTSLVCWHKEVLLMTLKKIIALRERNLGGKSVMVNKAELSQAETAAAFGNATPGYCIEFPVIDAPVEGKDIQLDKVVEEQLGKYVIDIADTYNPNPFHNVEHASHVALSATKLLESYGIFQPTLSG
ncbi:adenylate cyclase [Nitzschia inconspicua]|uniref:Adenylate cyclase n=1 Tax=Nitzschia inconspicua TaxID=303405 RepID=A0A9K3L111_9STRA|nr:adenylate cyclase [Nitzschia inconspicua]